MFTRVTIAKRWKQIHTWNWKFSIFIKRLLLCRTSYDFFVKIISAQKLLVKCWWNWLQDSFVDVVSLEELDLSHNRMTDLKRGCFRGLPSLKSVDLSHNRIRTFHSDAFVDTPLVEELRLNYNALNQVLHLFSESHLM